MTIADAISDAHSPARCRDVSLDLKSCYSCQMTSSLLPPFVSTYLLRRRIDWIKSKNVLFVMKIVVILVLYRRMPL